MRGQTTIIRMRLAHWKPAMVWLFVLDRPVTKRPMLDAERALELGQRPEVHIGCNEAAGTLDFRFLTGLTVLLQGENVERLRQVYGRLKQFNPERIITSTGDFIHDYRTAA